ncbi:hypothetical protein [Neisseria sp.]|uniref:hypothetical protein n=1 Tax=Neisseria sp. TaxID=192066 RepID=UPI0035A04C3C
MSEKKIVSLIKTQGKERTYQFDDGSIEKWSDGSVAWRNNNPGNLKFEYANSADKTVKTSRTKEKALLDAQKKYDGIVALDQFGNAIFETLDAGRAAKIKLLTTRFDNLTVHQMIRKYSVPDYTGKTNWDRQEESIYRTAEQQGVNLRNKQIGSMTEKELSALADGIAKFEGWKKGSITIIQHKSRQSDNETSENIYLSHNVYNDNFREKSPADELAALINGFRNDKDGTFADALRMKHPEIGERLEAEIQEKQQQLIQKEQLQTALKEQNTQQEIQERGFGGRSFG